MQFRNRRFDRDSRNVQTVGAPVISVGNLTLGGTGKTPCVAWIARWFRDRGIRVAIVSRGYRAVDGQRNDEALELEQRLPDVPHLQDVDRVAAAQTAVEELESQLILLDDGFQHRRLDRDVNIVLIDALEPFGFDHVFPRGTLREPLGGLARADIVCLSRSDLIAVDEQQQILARVARYNSAASVCMLAHAPHGLLTASQKTNDLTALQGTTVAAFCGIGNPTAFRKTLEACDAKIAAWKAYPDHHAYTRKDVQDLTAWAESANVEMIVCTQKDLVKLGVDRLGRHPLYALTIELQVTQGLSAMEEQLQEIADEIVG